MDISFTKTLIEIAEQENITKAAEKMGYTQSGLSHTLNRVENELGFKLFLRSKTGVKLTEEGKMLLPIAKEIERSAEKMYETITSIQGIEKGTITVGTISSISMNFLPPVLAAFGRDYPGINIDLKEGSVKEIHDLVMDHTVDIAITSIQEWDEFEYRILCEDPIVAVVPEDFDLKGKNTFDLKDFEKHHFIMPAMEKENDYDIDKVIKKYKLNLNARLSSKDDIAIVRMVEDGLGISCLPELITRDNCKTAKIVPVEPYCCRILGIAFDSLNNASPAALKFIDYAKRIIRQKTEK